MQEAARAIVSSSKFAPQGTRGCGSPFTHQVFSVESRTYELECNSNLLVIVQIESRSGVENVHDIASVDGVDVLFVGPFDLAKSMDIEFGGKEHEEAIAKTLKACKDNGKKAAIFCESQDVPLPCHGMSYRRPGLLSHLMLDPQAFRENRPRSV